MTRINGFEIINPETTPERSYPDVYKVERACFKWLLDRGLAGPQCGLRGRYVSRRKKK